MAPEQVLGQNVDFRTDLFAFGLLIYELTSGVNPFVANTLSATFARIIEEEPPALSKVRPQSLPALDRIVATCLRKNPVERYESTQHLVTDFEQLELELAQLRQHASDRSGARPAAPLGAWRSAWWRTHQVMIIGLYVVAVSLSWYIKEWVKVPVTVAVFIELGAGAIGGLLRGHLVFTQYFNWPNLTAQHRRVARALMVLDVLMGSALVVDAVMLVVWPLTAMFIVVLGIVIALAALVLEPATTKAALGDMDA